MRHFTKTHNDLKWLFPIAKTKKEAAEIFKSAEEQAKYLADMAGVEEKDRDLAIDCFMKGYSHALQMEVHSYLEKKVKDIYCNIFGVKCDLENEKEWNKYFRFHKFEDMLKNAMWDPKRVKKPAAYIRQMMEGSGFDMEAPIKEQLKVW